MREYPNLPLVQERFEHLIMPELLKEKETRKQKAAQEGQKQYGRYLIPAYRADVFLQSFPNTAGLHQAAGVISGQAFTDYYITVIYEEHTNIYGVFQGDHPVYKVTNPT